MLRRLYPAVLCATLGACAAQTGNPTATETPGTAQPAAQQQPARSDTRAAPPRQAAIDPASLVGMTGERITALFGAPVFVRRDPPGEFWRYRGQTCVLELFFYRQGGAQRVDHIETRNTGKNAEDRAKCIAKLRKPPAQG